LKTEDEFKEILEPSVIAKRVLELGERITNDYQCKPIILIGVLKGAVIFMADLARSIRLPVKLDFVRLSSYSGTDSTGGITFSKDIEIDIKGLDVLVVEDIIDTGYTIKYLMDVLKLHEPASVRICCLIDKKERRKVDVKADYVGFEIEHGFLVGYGLDYNEKYRHLPGVYQLNPGYKPMGFAPSDR
jgi:hypoxanthine phosphoribosyltransferase